MDSATIDLQHQFYDMLMQSQFWSAERMRDYQRSQLTQLLRHAKKNVPFYEGRLDAVLKPNGDIDWDRWSEIPIVKRSDLIEHREAMLARELPPGHGPISSIQTSGSTGTPVEVLITRLSHLAAEAARWRAADWHDLDFSQNLCIRQGANPKNKPPEGIVGGAWGPPWLPHATGRGYTMDRGWPVADQLDYVLNVGSPYVAMGNPKMAQLLALEAQQRSLNLRLERILVSGEKAGEDDRRICLEVFGCEITELYSSKEGGHMAHRCRVRRGFHVNSERLLVELLNDEGQPVAAGVAGRVVITPFFSTAQPLIRYDHGDMATWGSGCGCGTTLPFLASIEGRSSHMFRHPDGRKMHRGIPEEARLALDATLWQFAQIGPTRFEVRYVPRNPQKVGDELHVADVFRQYYFDDATVVFKRVDTIPTTAAGKFMEFVYEVPQTE